MGQTGSMSRCADLRMTQRAVASDRRKYSRRIRVGGLHRLLAVGFEPLQHICHFRIVEYDRRANLAGQSVLSRKVFHFDCKRKGSPQTSANGNHAVIGQQTGRAVFQRDQHIVRQFLGAKSPVTGASQRIATCRGHHVVKCRNVIGKAGKCGGVGRMGVYNCLRFGTGGKNIKMHTPFRRRQEITAIYASQFHFDNVVFLHPVIGDAGCSNDKTCFGSHTNISGSALVETRVVHLKACCDYVLFERRKARICHQSASSTIPAHRCPTDSGTLFKLSTLWHPRRCPATNGERI